MKRTLICALFGIAASNVSAQERDGTWFAGLSELTQLAYIAGHLEGMSWGMNAALLSSCSDDPAPIPCLQKRDAALNDGYRKYLRVTTGQMHSGVKAFYSDFRNTKLLVSYAIIHTGKAIHGVPSAELDKSLETLRGLSSNR